MNVLFSQASGTPGRCECDVRAERVCHPAGRHLADSERFVNVLARPVPAPRVDDTVGDG